MFFQINFILSGERDETEVRILSDSKRTTFRRGAVDGFLMAVPRYIYFVLFIFFVYTGHIYRNMIIKNVSERNNPYIIYNHTTVLDWETCYHYNNYFCSILDH